MNKTIVQKLFPIMLAVFMVIGMFPLTALAAFPDLAFTLEPGSAVSKTKLHIEDTAYDKANHTLQMNNTTAPSTYSQGTSMTGIGVTVTSGTEFTLSVRIGTYINLFEVDASKNLVNRGSIQITNAHLPAPTPGTTALSGGVDKITVSSYQAVEGCKLYLVPESLYPTDGGAIDISNNGIKEITADGDISVEAGAYKLYTVYIGSFSGANHGAYYEGSAVTVTTAAANACQIGGTPYLTLDAALAAVGGGETITLLQNINHTQPVVIEDINIVFDLNGFNLSIDTGEVGDSVALTVEGGSVSYIGSGAFTVCGGSGSDIAAGVKVRHGTAALSGIFIKTDYGTGAWALDDDSRITVNGDIRTVGETEYARAVGADARMGAAIEVNGAIALKGSNCTGAYTNDRGKVTVNPGSGVGILVEGDYAVGAEVRNGSESEITVNGGVRAVGGDVSGADAEFGLITVHGSVAVEGNDSYGVLARDTGRVRVNGHVTVTGDAVTGVRAEMGEGAGGTVRVAGNVVLTGDTEETSIGVYCHSSESTSEKSAVTVDGEVDAPLYLEIDGVLREKDSKDSVDEAGYRLYNGANGSIVKVGNGATAVLPTVSTGMVNPLDIRSTGVHLRGGVTSGTESVVDFGFVWGLSADPTIYNHSTAGEGTAASFSADLIGLVPDTTYYVRAYATNSAGTAYGENRTFTTVTSDPLGAPQNLRYLAHDGAAELIWDAPAGAEGITHYELMRGNDLAGGTWEDIGDDTTHTVTGLTNGVNTYFNLRAANADGPGEHIGFWAMANIPTVPGAPTSLVASGGNGWVNVSWHAPLNTGHRPITGYHVSADNSTWSALVTDTSYHFPGLTNGVEYTFYVRAVNAVGAGESASAQAAPRSTGGGYVGGGGGSSVPAPAQTAVPDDDGKVSSDEKAAEPWQNPFADVKAGDWFYGDVAFTAANGLFFGTGAAAFSPNTPMTRAMFVTVLHRLAGSPAVSANGVFGDVTEGKWYYETVNWAAESGIIDGIGNNLFAPSGNVTREQTAAILAAYARFMDIDLPKNRSGVFADEADISPWAKDAVSAMYAAGILNGKPGELFDPKGTVTRAEVAAVLHRFIIAVGDDDIR